MNRKFCLIRRYVRSYTNKDSFIYYHDLDDPVDTLGQFGFIDICENCYRVPFTINELVNKLGMKVFYNRSEFLFDDHKELISIKCGDRFLCVKPKKQEFSYLTQKEINKLMFKNFG